MKARNLSSTKRKSNRWLNEDPWRAVIRHAFFVPRVGDPKKVWRFPERNRQVRAISHRYHQHPWEILAMKFRDRAACFLILALSVVLAVGCSKPTSPANDSPTSARSNSDAGNSSRAFSGSSLSEWPKQFEEMKDVLDLSESEQQTLKSTFEEHTATVQGWYNENGDKYADLNRQIMQAVKARNAAKLKCLKRQAEPLRDEAMKLHKQMDLAILAALPGVKQFQWEGHLLARRMLKLTESLGLNQEQENRIKQLAVRAAENIKSNTNRTAEGFVNLEKSVQRNVLTAAQQSEFEKIKKKNPFRSLGN